MIRSRHHFSYFVTLPLETEEGSLGAITMAYAAAYDEVLLERMHALAGLLGQCLTYVKCKFDLQVSGVVCCICPLSRLLWKVACS